MLVKENLVLGILIQLNFCPSLTEGDSDCRAAKSAKWALRIAQSMTLCGPETLYIGCFISAILEGAMIGVDEEVPRCTFEEQALILLQELSKKVDSILAELKKVLVLIRYEDALRFIRTVRMHFENLVVVDGKFSKNHYYHSFVEAALHPFTGILPAMNQIIHLLTEGVENLDSDTFWDLQPNLCNNETEYGFLRMLNHAYGLRVIALGLDNKKIGPKETYYIAKSIYKIHKVFVTKCSCNKPQERKYWEKYCYQIVRADLCAEGYIITVNSKETNDFLMNLHMSIDYVKTKKSKFYQG